MSDIRIPWWKTDFGEEAVSAVSKAIREKKISQGEITGQFEKEIAKFLRVPHVVATSSGSTALLMALMACGVRPGDEVIVPNRTWVATGHAAYLLGAEVVLYDVQDDKPVLDVDAVVSQLTEKTRAIIPVYMNGRGLDVASLIDATRDLRVSIVEDAAQAFGSRSGSEYLGTQGTVGCFSLSVAKIFSSGQGGFAVTRSDELVAKLRNIRTQGIESVFDPIGWPMPGLNFRFTDMQASVARTQLRKVRERISYCREIYEIYSKGLAGLPGIKVIPVDLASNEVPVYNEILVDSRERFIHFLRSRGIETRPFYPSLERASYFNSTRGNDFPNSRPYENSGVYLPSGPGQSLDDIHEAVEIIRKGVDQQNW